VRESTPKEKGKLIKEAETFLSLPDEEIYAKLRARRV